MERHICPFPHGHLQPLTGWSKILPPTHAPHEAEIKIAHGPHTQKRGVPKARAYLSYQPSRKARPRVPLNRLNIIRAGVASLSISIFSAARARTAKM